jgi:prepilin-type N-terminal cleavage/methylation domain-containing protein
MTKSIARRPGGFTLVEMLVVIAIIAILAALLIPAASMAIGAARRARNGVEIASLVGAMSRYTSENGGLYPPSFGEGQAKGKTYATMLSDGSYKNSDLYRYLIKAYPKISNTDIAYLFGIADKMDQGSALVFWLSQTKADPRKPFTGPGEYRKYFEFEEARLVPFDTTIGSYGYKPPYAKESCYIYIESKHYQYHVAGTVTDNQAGGSNPPPPAKAGSLSAENSVRPFLKQNRVDASADNPKNYMNSDTFQLFCAGLDGRFTAIADPYYLRVYPGGETGLTAGGGAQDYTQYADDRDNQTNFSDGATLESKSAQ